MSGQGVSPNSAPQRLPSPPLRLPFALEKVDVHEQERIYEQVSLKLETAYERAIQEAVKRSLSTASDTASAETDSVVGDNPEVALDQPSLSAVSLVADMDDMPTNDDDHREDLVTVGAAAASPPTPGSRVKTSGSMNNQASCHHDLLGSGVGSSAQTNGAANLSDSDDEDGTLPRSRRGRYHRRQQQRTERRPSLDRVNGIVSERRPSLDRLHNSMSERRPSLEGMNHYQSERRPSLDRRDANQSDRRPSLDRADQYNSERRPSLERASDYQSERRPSLERMERRPSVERSNGPQSERRPSLERVQQHGLERRPSLDRMQSVEQRLQSLNNTEEPDGTTQGINTLRPWPLGETGFPTNWDLTQLPDRQKDGLYRLVTLSPMDREYKAVAVDFEEAGLKVGTVERLQNPMLVERFHHEKEQLLKVRPSDFDLNERYLYHGTKANQHCLCEEGLDHRLSFQGCFGRGIYFSDNPRKCMQYANTNNYDHDSASTRPMMLVCRVLLGESKRYDQGIKDPSLKREPEKRSNKGGWRYYDSVQGIPVDYPEFVVYDNRRSMIEYIITFEEVGYRAPPSVYNFYTKQVPSLYKVEPITLPIPEDELDKLYMLGPDTDSDGSCDEHTREVERLRDNVKRGKAKRLGIPYRPPTKEEKRYERLHWKRVCYYSCPPDSPLYQLMIIKKKEEKAERKKKKQQEIDKKLAEDEGETESAPTEEEGAVGGVGITTTTTTTTLDVNVNSPTEEEGLEATGTSPTVPAQREEFDVENESVAEVLSNLIADFLNITTTDDVPSARRYILDNDMDLEKAVSQFFS